MNNENLAKGSKPGRISPRKALREKMKDRIVDLYLEGKSIDKVKLTIRQESGIRFGSPAIAKILKKVVAEWESNKSNAIAEHKARELEKINRLEIEYARAWERSCQELAARTQERIKATPEARKLMLSRITETQRQNIGDSRFLDGIQWCIEMRCKLLGLEAPKQLEVNKTMTIIRRTNFIVRKPPIPIPQDADGSTEN